MTSPFSFNFQIDNDTETSTTASTIVHTSDTTERHHHSNHQNFHPSSTTTSTRRIPFQWIDTEYATALLAERSQEEIVYSGISLSKYIGSDRDDDTYNGDTNRNRNCNARSHVNHIHSSDTTTTTTMRCVDLSESSYTKPSSVENERNDAHLSAETDIIPGIYEGGRKVWECSCDLVQYLLEQNITLLHSCNGTNDDDDDKNRNVQSAQEFNIDTIDIQRRNESSFRRPLYALELGCGHALPGCYVLQQSILSLQKNDSNKDNDNDGNFNNDSRNVCTDFTVIFTDYNESVLLDATLSNIVLNTATTASLNSKNNADKTMIDVVANVANHILLGGGDWMDMSNQIQQYVTEAQDNDRTKSCDRNHCHRLPADGYFDMILAAETVYTTSAAYEMAVLLQNHLRPHTGVAYIATKRYYFGVGGGADVFRNFCHNMGAEQKSTKMQDDSHDRHQRLTVETVKVIDNGTGNIREILRVQSKPPST